MSVLQRAILLIAITVLVGCGSTAPLPEGEMPNDFLFVFTHERLTNFDATVELPVDGEEVPEDGAGEEGAPEEGAPEEGAPEDGEAEADEAAPPEVKEAPPPEEITESSPEAGEADEMDPEGDEGAEGTEENPPEAGDGDEMAPETAEDGENQPEDAPTGEESAEYPLPSFVKVTVDVVGRTDIEVTHVLPRKNTSRSTITISREDLQELYELIRAADLYNMPEEYEDGDWKLGKETYFVIGRNKPRRITVTGTVVEDLRRIRERLLDMLPVKDLLTLPLVIENLVIMDRRNGVFYRADEEAVQEIPEQYRKEYKDPWGALNDGGNPSPSFGPLPKEWD